MPIPVDPDELLKFRDHTLYRLLTRAQRAHNDEMTRRLQERGYRDVQQSYARLLSNLDPDGSSIVLLAARAGVTRQAASQLLKEIEAKGYVRREPDPDDARAVIVRRTARGERLLRDALEVVSELEAEYAEAVGPRKVEQLRTLLTELLRDIDPTGGLSRD